MSFITFNKWNVIPCRIYFNKILGFRFSFPKILLKKYNVLLKLIFNFNLGIYDLKKL